MRPPTTPHISRRLLAAAWPAFALLVLLMMSCAAAEQCLLRTTQPSHPCCECAAQVQTATTSLHIKAEHAHRDRGELPVLPSIDAPHPQIATLKLAPKTSPPV